MDKKDVISFFDDHAANWDAEMIKSDEKIAAILDNCAVREGADVLDVACGTGVLFPYYLDRKVASLTAIDISPEMVKIAREKYPGLTIICGDVETYDFDRQFDAVMVYNAFPHFPDPAATVKSLAALTKKGGRMSVAHGMSKAAIDRHHSGPAHKVSIGLLEVDELKQLFDPYFDVDIVISNDEMYQICGVKK